MQIQISCLLQKPADLDLHCLQRQGISGSAGQGLKNFRVGATWWRKIRQSGNLKHTRFFFIILGLILYFVSWVNVSFYFLQDLLDQVIQFQADAKEALEAETPDSQKLEHLIDFGITLDVELSEIPKLKQVGASMFLKECGCRVLNT